MFGNGKMKQMIREADKIVSSKQDMDSLSWGRVQEIAKELQDSQSAEAARELGRELAVIAQINLSMFSRMGVVPQTMWASNQPAPTAANAVGVVMTDDESKPVVLPSGMEVIEGGLVEAVLENPELATVPLNPVSPTPGSPVEDELQNALAEESAFLDNPARSFDLDGGDADAQQAAPHPAASQPEAQEDGLPEHDDRPAESPQPVEVKPEPEQPESQEVAEPKPAETAEHQVEPQPPQSQDGDEPQGAAPQPESPQGAEQQPAAAQSSTQQPGETAEKEPPASASDLSARVSGPSIESSDDAAAAAGPRIFPNEETKEEGQVDGHPDAPSESAGAADGEDGGAPQAPGGEGPGSDDPMPPPNDGRVGGEASVPRSQFASFRHIYESRDGGLCVFKDEHGHLVSVRASRLV